jgi:hypothetical protein
MISESKLDSEEQYIYIFLLDQFQSREENPFFTAWDQVEESLAL